MNSFQIFCCATCNFHTSSNGACDGDELRDFVFYERLASIAITNNHIDDTFGQKFLHQFSHPDCGDGRCVAWLENNSISCSNRGSPFPYCHHHGVIPWRYLCANPDWFATNKRGMSLEILSSRTSFKMSSSTCKESNLIQHWSDFFCARDCDWFASIFTFNLYQFF